MGISRTEETLRAQLGPEYERLPALDRSRYAELLDRIRRPVDLEMLVRKEGPDAWVITVVTADCIGTLSILASLFTTHGMSIQSGDVFTLRFALPPQPRSSAARYPRRAPFRIRPSQVQLTQKVLDIFRIRGSGREDDKFWEIFRDRLATWIKLISTGDLWGARERILDQLSATEVVAAVGAETTEARERVLDQLSATASTTDPSTSLLPPLTVTVDNTSSSGCTCLRIHSTDTLGFLFEFTNALALLNVNIERVKIRTPGGEVHDTFWVTDSNGNKILDEDRLLELRVAASLIKQFTHLLPRSPNPAQALHQFTALSRQMLARKDWTSELKSLESDAVLGTLADLMGVSRFLWDDFLRLQHENLFPILQNMPALEGRKTPVQLRDQLEQQLEESPQETDARTRLNRFKDQEMFRIDLRHITHRIDFLDFSTELSDLAEAVISKAADLSFQNLQERMGKPLRPDGGPCAWCVSALGKFGGREMGFASDVELIFVYENEGTLQGPNPVSHSHFFQEWVQNFSTMIPSRRAGIFAIDFALRPHGNAGKLACSQETFRHYYTQGGDARQFERMALVKLRPVAGDASLGEAILKMRDAFVYSGDPLDYEGILHLRRRQAKELVGSGQVSAKFSPGGLVDVEYFVQTRQIAAGHRDPSVRTENTWEALDRLRKAGHLNQEQTTRLRDTYAFLRKLIDALRVVRGHAQDLTLPPSDSREFAYLVRRLQYDSVTNFTRALTDYMDFARNLWKDAEGL